MHARKINKQQSRDNSQTRYKDNKKLILFIVFYAFFIIIDWWAPNTHWNKPPTQNHPKPLPAPEQLWVAIPEKSK